MRLSPLIGEPHSVFVMSEFFSNAVSIVLDILGYVLMAENFWFSAFFYIALLFSLFVLLFQIFRR